MRYKLIFIFVFIYVKDRSILYNLLTQQITHLNIDIQNENIDIQNEDIDILNFIRPQLSEISEIFILILSGCQRLIDLYC